MAEKMMAVMKTKTGPGAEIVEVPVPKIKPDEILVKVKCASICGTDAHIYYWDEWAAGRIKPPMIFGHEFAGVVVEIGSQVKSIKVGDCLSGETHIPCGFCFQCRTGNQHICANLKILGVDTNGAFAEYIAIPEVCAWKNDPSMPFEFATVQEPFGNAMYTVQESHVAGKDVCIIGDGPIGSFAVGIAKASGCGKLIGVGKRQKRLDIVTKMGADHSILADPGVDVVKKVNELTHGNGVDVVLDMVGSEEAIGWGLKMLKKAGTFTAFGIPSTPPKVDFANGIIFKGAKIIGINGRKMFETWYQVANMLNGKLVDPRPVITHKFHMKDFMKAMELTQSPTGEASKVIIIVDEK
jgi:threonine 3-dehydrogenase